MISSLSQVYIVDIVLMPLNFLRPCMPQLSLWNCVLGGPIEAGAVCRLRGLWVLAVSQNAMHGTVPECIAASVGVALAGGQPSS